jgi:hypothetical protein
MEIETICRYRLPIVTVVFNNGGIYRGDKPGEFPPSPTGLAPNAGYDKLIEAFGGVGYNAEDKGSLTKALTDALPAGRPALINCVIDPAASLRQAWRVSALPDRPRSERPLRQADRSVRRRRLPVCFPGALFYLCFSLRKSLPVIKADLERGPRAAIAKVMARTSPLATCCTRAKRL